MSNMRIKISFNSPVVLGFSLICLGAFVMNIITWGVANNLLFSVYYSSLANPLTYVRFFGHAVGHASWAHFFGNITLILVVGPMLEEKYGSWNMLFVILSTALITGIVNFVFFPNVQLLGASGVVFAFILLSSLSSMKDGTLPMTFILIAIIYIGGQIYDGLFVDSNVSNLTHILGGLTGSGLGYIMQKHRMGRY